MNTQSDTLQKNLQIIREEKIKVTYCESFDDTSEIWCFDSHKHNDIEMMYFRSGVANIEVSSKTIRISSYDVIIYPAGAYHRETLFPSVRQEVICLRVEIAGLNLEHPIHIKDRNQVLGVLFRKIHADYHQIDGSGVNLMEDYARILLLSCLAVHAEARATNDLLNTAMEYIMDHYCERISIPDISNIAHVCDTYLNRCFKKRTGTSIIKYVNMLRIEKAKHMLIATDYSIDHIAATVGFNSPKYFSRAFKAYTQATPSGYRSKMKT